MRTDPHWRAWRALLNQHGWMGYRLGFVLCGGPRGGARGRLDRCGRRRRRKAVVVLAGLAVVVCVTACSGAGDQGSEGSTTSGQNAGTGRSGGGSGSPGAKIRVKVVTVVASQDLSAMGREGSGEAHWWYTEGGLSTEHENPGGYGPVYGNKSGDHLLLIAGPGKSNAGASVMALGLNPIFDLTEAYWVQAGISGGNPEKTTIGSAVWEHWIADGEISSQINPLELDQQHYAMQVGCTQPPFCPQALRTGTEVFELNGALQERAVELSSQVQLDNPKSLDAMRTPYPQEAANKPPSVQKGDLFAGDTFASGSMLSSQMAWWVQSATGGRGAYSVGASEEPAVATALTRLTQVGLARFDRYAAVRSPRNFDQQHPSQTALEGLAAASPGGQPESEATALRNCYLAANTLTAAIVHDWDRWKGGVPAR